LAEVEVYAGSTNLAQGALVTASESFDSPWTPEHVTDGNRGSQYEQDGIWLLPSKRPGWVHVHLNRK
jgi:hypothetical protein